jgi:hypothetical protein
MGDDYPGITQPVAPVTEFEFPNSNAAPTNHTNGYKDPISEQNGFKLPTEVPTIPTGGIWFAPSYPDTSFQLEDRHIDEQRYLRVAVIRAGLAGITARILFPAKVSGINLTIYEKNEDDISRSDSLTSRCITWALGMTTYTQVSNAIFQV